MLRKTNNQFKITVEAQVCCVIIYEGIVGNIHAITLVFAWIGFSLVLENDASNYSTNYKTNKVLGCWFN